MALSSASDAQIIVVGSGMNSLVCAALLAQRGKSVLVLERNDRLGGCIRTEELFPGYRHDVLSSWYPLFVGGPAYAALKPALQAAGLEFAQCDYATGLALPDGSGIALKQDIADSARRLDAWAPGDGAAFGAMAQRLFGEDAALTFGLLGQNPYGAGMLKLLFGEWRRRGLDGLMAFAADSLESFRRWSDRELQSDAARALIAPWVLHTGLGPDDACSALIGKLTFAAVVAGGMPVVKGGSQGVVDALAKIIEQHGGRLRTGAAVERILTHGEGRRRRAVGVVAAGREYRAREAVVCNVAPGQLYGTLLPDAPEPVRRRAAGYRHGRGGMQIHFALDAPPDWRTPELRHVPLVHLTESMEQVCASVTEANNGLLPARPTLAIGQPVAVDPSRAGRRLDPVGADAGAAGARQGRCRRPDRHARRRPLDRGPARSRRRPRAGAAGAGHARPGATHRRPPQLLAGRPGGAELQPGGRRSVRGRLFARPVLLAAPVRRQPGRARPPHAAAQPFPHRRRHPPGSRAGRRFRLSRRTTSRAPRGQERNMSRHLTRRLACAAALALAGGVAQATEGGGLGIYPDGLENFMSGALPPPGVHMLVYGGGARYDKLRGNDGERLPVPDFKVDVNVLAPRLIWVTPQQVLGGQLAFHAIAPLLDVTFKAGGQRYRSTGLGDMTLGVALGYHLSESLHYVVGLDMYAPTGEYDRKDPSSLGKNYWTAQPVFALSRISPDGFNADLKLMYDFNFRNSATDTRSGQAIHADYAVGWGVGKGWVLGVGGHAFQQVTDDNGPNSAAGRARAFGVGPSVRYMNDRGWLFTAKWQQEFQVKNRPEGAQLYVKLAIPF